MTQVFPILNACRRSGWLARMARTLAYEIPMMHAAFCADMRGRLHSGQAAAFPSVESPTDTSHLGFGSLSHRLSKVYHNRNTFARNRKGQVHIRVFLRKSASRDKSVVAVALGACRWMAHLQFRQRFGAACGLCYTSPASASRFFDRQSRSAHAADLRAFQA